MRTSISPQQLNHHKRDTTWQNATTVQCVILGRLVVNWPGSLDQTQIKQLPSYFAGQLRITPVWAWHSYLPTPVVLSMPPDLTKNMHIAIAAGIIFDEFLVNRLGCWSGVSFFLHYHGRLGCLLRICGMRPCQFVANETPK